MFVGNSDQITVTLTGDTSGQWYNKELTFTYQLPSNLKITSAGAGNGAACVIYAGTNKLKCTYPAQAFQGGTAQINIYTKGVTDGVVYPKITVTTDGSVSTLDHVSSSSITIIGGNSGGGTNQGDAPGTTGTGESSDTSLGDYTLTKTASTNYISKKTDVTYTYVIKNNSTKDYVATPANAAPTDVLTDNKCANITFGSGWGITDGHRTIAPGSSASLACTMPVSSTMTNIATSKNLTFASKATDGTWNWNDATLKSTTAQNTVYYIDDPSVDPGTNQQQQSLDYITPGTAMPISCSVPKIWDAASMDVTTQKSTPDTYLYEMYQGASTFAYKATSGLYTDPGAYWQYGVDDSGNAWQGSQAQAFKPVTNVNHSYNAIAYNKKDHLIYGFTNPDNNVRSGQLISIDANGNIRRMGIYMPYPTWDSSVTGTAEIKLKQEFRQLQGNPAPWSATQKPTGGLNSAFFDDDGNFYVSEGSMGGDGSLYKFDLKTGAMTKVITGTLEKGMWASDYAYSNGYAYGIEQPWIRNPETGQTVSSWSEHNNPHGNMLAQVNLKTGEIKYLALPKTIEGNDMAIDQVYDTAWTYGNGDIGLVPNNGGVWYHLHIDNPDSAAPTVEMRVNDTVPVTYNADGTACADWPADLSIKKSQLSTKVAPDGTVTWRIVVKNNGPGVSSGFNVHDVMPKGFTYVSGTFPSDAKDDDGNAITNNTGKCVSNGASPAEITCEPLLSADGMAAGESRVIEITAKAPSTSDIAADSSKQCFQNTAHVYGNEKDSNSDNDESTTPQVCFAGKINVTKTADSLYTDGPDANGVYTAHYTVKVKNTGSVAMTYTRVTDTPDMTNVDIKSVTWSGGPGNASATAATLESMYVPTWTISSTASKTLAAGATDTYKVTVKFTLASGVTVSTIKPCTATSTGYSGGFVNTANVSGATETGTENVACVQPKIPITVKKLGRNCDTDKKTCPLQGARFALYDTDPMALGATPIADSLTTDSNGYFQTEPLKPGTDYWLV